MTEESENQLDLTSLSFDLERSFQPAWALELEASEQSFSQTNSPSPPIAEETKTNLAKKLEKARRRKAFSSQTRGKPSPPSADDSQTSHPSEERHHKIHSKKRNKKNRKQQPPKPEKFLPGWEIRILPEERGLDGLARQIKISLKAYPLFDLARLILERPERFRIVFRRKGETPLFHHLPDGTLWRDEEHALDHSLRAQFDKYYRRELVPCEPPKGNFPCVAQVGENGEILGPPNHHDYQLRLRKVYAEKYSRLSFESFLSKIRMVRNPEAIEKWRQEQSVREEFVFIRNPRVKKSDSENKPDASLVTPPSNESLPADNSQDNPPEPQQPKQTQINSDDFHKPATNTAENPSPSVATEVPTAQSASTSPENSSAPQVTQPSETESNASSPSADTSANSSLDDKVGEIRLKSYLEVRNHYRTNIFSRVCEQVREKVTIRGTAAERSDESIHKAVRAAWLNLVRFPLPLAVSLGHALSARGVQLFKAHENITYCAATRPRFLDRSAYPVSDGVSKILDYIEANPDVPRHEQWKALLTVRASVLTPDLPAEQQIESSGIEATLASELAWLLREGFIIDFAKKGFQISSTAVKNLNQKNKEKKPDEKQPDTPAEAKLEAKSNQKQPTSIPLTANQPNLSESPPSLQESPQLEETCETLCESSVEAPRAQEPTAIPDSNNLPQTTDSIPTKEDIVGDITNAPSSKTSSSRTEVSESATEFKTSSAHSGELQPPPANQ